MTWFKQAHIYQFTAKNSKNKVVSEDLLDAMKFRPCLPTQAISFGWVSPFEQNDDGPLVHSANGVELICLQFEEKVLPPAVVKQTVNEQVKTITDNTGRKVSNKEKRDLMDEATFTLLPKAFSKLSRVYAYIDPKNHWLIINTTSAKLEKFHDCFKKSSGDNHYEKIETKKIGPRLTRWVLKNDYPSTFSIEEACVLKDPNLQARTIRVQHQDLSAAAIKSFLGDVYEVHQLSLNWCDNISFTLAHDFTLSGIKYHDEVIDLAKADYSETDQAKFDADFVIMSESLSNLFKDLLEDMGLDAPQQNHETTQMNANTSPTREPESETA